ncbi:hypothetical protein [Erythrobacter sp. SG61-1L]|uniref:COG3650 family protein n=1 Tax=Erythrobacter sp. SG61-1L TaxID=1603897 RepID=UPI0006C91303|nr:hypothetical protein [Erythrobacter sp. SG61-1L]
MRKSMLFGFALLSASLAGALLAGCGSGASNAGDATPTPVQAVTASPEPDPVSLSFLPAEIRAAGTEPFWSVDIDRTELTYTTPENLSSGGVKAPVTRADGAESVLFTANLEGQILQILVTPGECSDGMSDNSYPWTVERTLGEETAQGCAKPAEE